MNKTLLAALLPALLLTAPNAARAADETNRRAATQAELDALRDELRELTGRMTSMSLDLAHEPVVEIMKRIEIDPDRAMLGVHIAGTPDGVRIAGVTPGGPAAAAGLESGDVIVALDGTDLASMGGDDAMHALMAFMDQIEAGQVVNVTLERDGRRQTVPVTSQPMGDAATSFSFSSSPDFEFHVGEMADGHAFAAGDGGFSFSWHTGPWADLEVVPLTPGLGNYFGVSEGLLVVRAPDDASLALEDGDVLVSLDGEPLREHADLLRRLAARDKGDRLQFGVVRQRSQLNVTAQMPERSNSFLPGIIKKKKVIRHTQD